MKNYIKHLLRYNLDEVVEKSFLNCHARGVHSIMIDDTPEKRIRIFYATEEHELYKNFLNDEKMSVAYHPHHCDITIEVISGLIKNSAIIPYDKGEISLTGFKYHSKITDGECYFEKIDDNFRFTINKEKNGTFVPKESLFLPARELHTIAIAKGKSAAWYVYEGQEDLMYIPYCYTNTDPNEGDMSDMYIKPTKQEVIDILKDLLLI